MPAQAWVDAFLTNAIPDADRRFLATLSAENVVFVGGEPTPSAAAHVLRARATLDSHTAVGTGQMRVVVVPELAAGQGFRIGKFVIVGDHNDKQRNLETAFLLSKPIA
jgi:hypothetical protein